MDYTIEQWINGPAGAHPAWDAAMQAVATLAEPAFILVVAAWFVAGWLRRRPSDRLGALTALFAAGLALLINQLISHVWARPRPFVAHPVTVHVLSPHTADASFPSDHTAAAFAIAVTLVAAHRRLGVVALLAGVAVGYARVYVGDHYPGDVAAGAVVGVVAALLLLTWARPLLVAVQRHVDEVMARMRLLPEPSKT